VCHWPALVLTGGLIPDERTQHFCQAALDTGVTVLTTTMDTYYTTHCLAGMDTSVPMEDTERVEKVMQATAEGIDAEWLRQHLSVDREPRLSPPAFRYLLTQRAREANKRIVLPEGKRAAHPRRSGSLAARNGAWPAARLSAPQRDIHTVAESKGISLPEGIEIIDPDEVRESYIDAMVELRRHKGMKPDMAEALLEDNVMLATLMVALDEMDGLVSGAVHTTANTIRPALQLIKTHEQARIVSSVFFMCLPDQVRVYGDCAVNPDPNAEELADIAIQSADSATTFGITPKVAMVSYSTGDSGTGDDVEKVRKATAIARKRRPDLIIDGPCGMMRQPLKAWRKARHRTVRLRARQRFCLPRSQYRQHNLQGRPAQRQCGQHRPYAPGPSKKPVNDLSRAPWWTILSSRSP